MNIAVFLAPGFEEIEALTAVDYLRRAGQEVVTVGVPAAGDTDAPSVVGGAHGVKVTADQTLPAFTAGVDAALPDAIYFPGGMPGASNLAACPALHLLIGKMEQAGRLVAAMCASPAVVLAKSGILAGRKWTCYPGMEADLAKWCGSAEAAAEKTRGAEHIAGVPFIYNKNLLTGRGPGTAEQFAMKFVEILCGEATADKIRAASCQR